MKRFTRFVLFFALVSVSGSLLSSGLLESSRPIKPFRPVEPVKPAYPSRHKPSYNVLGVPVVSSRKTCRKAWKKKILSIHPDKVGPNPEASTVNSAWAEIKKYFNQRAAWENFDADLADYTECMKQYKTDMDVHRDSLKEWQKKVDEYNNPSSDPDSTSDDESSESSSSTDNSESFSSNSPGFDWSTFTGANNSNASSTGKDEKAKSYLSNQVIAAFVASTVISIAAYKYYSSQKRHNVTGEAANGVAA